MVRKPGMKKALPALLATFALLSAATGPERRTIAGAGPGKKVAVTRQSLGKMLFFDPILSSDSSISCASCHKPENYFADNRDFSLGVGGKKTARNTPSVLNMANRDQLFWDGRAHSLEHQALFPIRDPNEMNLPAGEAVARLNRNKRYSRLFRLVYRCPPNEKNLGDALAAYESTLETAGSKFDLSMKGKARLTEDELEGQRIFVGKGNCFDCHFGQDFTGDEFKNIGLYDGITYRDPGRFGVTRDSADLGKFKVPGLRNVARTGPYMHDGSFRTLREVIDYYANPGQRVPGAIGTDNTVRKGLDLNEKEKQQLEAFLNTLTSPLP